MDNQFIQELTEAYLTGTITKYELFHKFEQDICDSVMNYAKNRHLQVEISIAWDDEDEFEHEGYYDSVDNAINALMKYKENYENN